MHAVELAVGTVLSQPLRPALPESSPHPLRYGWLFESAPLSEAEAASVRLHQPSALVRGPEPPYAEMSPAIKPVCNPVENP